MHLALETSTNQASIAIVRSDEILRTASLDPSQPSTSCLIPRIDNLLAANNIRASQIDLVSVSIGPGSFTGLRIGVSVAKTLAFALNCKLTSVCSLEVIADQAAIHAATDDEFAPDGSDLICAVMDAQRNQWFAASFQRIHAGDVRPLTQPRIVEPTSYLDSVAESTLFCGPGLRKFAGYKSDLVRFVPERHWTPRADTVARLGRKRFQAGLTVDPFQLVPQYYRPSAAEEKLRSAGSGES